MPLTPLSEAGTVQVPRVDPAGATGGADPPLVPRSGGPASRHATEPPPMRLEGSVLERDMCYAPHADMGRYLSASTLGDDAAGGNGHGADVPAARAMAVLAARALGSRAAHLDEPADPAAWVQEAQCVHSAAWRSLRACDALLAQLLQALRDCARCESTLVVVTATFGASLRGHGHGADAAPWDASMRTFVAICPAGAGALRGHRCDAFLPLASLTELLLWHSSPDQLRDEPCAPSPWPLGLSPDDSAAAAL